jgi:hypothetical protein
METVLAALLATAIEVLIVVLIIAPRWTLRRIASIWRRLLYGSSSERTRQEASAQTSPSTSSATDSTIREAR